ncbi:aspartate aminotransferase family protein [Mycolicibacterium mengxianglii]|uniref:aspartate aminotransferase family protein n=1 Tax=Mycolicibacterium mengxianglii TaxID=2736649 RepID=UPI0018EF2FAD|nr:aminotransferase class III-fold pyridoxal phosphate-dependent enzyme [Mycolicibacterium mengxianglii]
MQRAEGCRIQTDEGEFIDMFMAHGSNVVGHGRPEVVDAIKESLGTGVIAGYETGLGAEVASILTQLVPSAQAVRFVASGSEAAHAMMRIARAYTQRDIIIRIDGHFHGGSDYAMFNQLAPAIDADNPGGQVSRPIIRTGGVPAVVADTIAVVPWQDIDALHTAFAAYEGRVAGVLLTPIDYNNGCIVPERDYLAQVRDAATAHGAVLMFDEVLSGFKTGTDCAQGMFGVTPDLTALSKALSSSMPLSAIVGSVDVMSTVMRPGLTGTIQGGTYAGNIPGLAAAKATLDLVRAPDFYPSLYDRAEAFYRDLRDMFARVGLPATVQHAGCGFGIYVGTTEPVVNYAQVREFDGELRRQFFAACIANGVYFHTDFTVSDAHTPEDLHEVLTRMEHAAKTVV